MPQRRNDPRLREAILAMTNEGKGCRRISEHLEVAKSTVRWHLTQVALEPAPEEPLPDERPICFVCSAPCQSWDGHPGCRGKKAA